MSNPFENNVGKTATFTIYPASIIMEDFTDVKILGVVSAEVASGMGLAEKHVLVYPTLPEGTPNDYLAYNYLMVRLPNGNITTLGLPWIIPDSIRISSSVDINVLIRGKGVDDIDNLRKVLAGNGYNDVTITTLSNG